MDLPCLKCEYNLRGLDDDVGCPECGESVYESARLVRLCQHDPTWLRKLARATIGIGIAVVVFVLYLPFVVLMSASSSGPGLKERYVALALGTAAGLLGLLGVITAPHRGDHIGLRRVRRVARWSMAAGLANIVLAMIVDAFFRADA